MKVGIIGAGAWGTAVSVVAAENGHSVSLWAREPEVVTELRERRTNSRFLQGVQISDSIEVVDDIAVLSSSDILINATPTQFIASILGPLSAADTLFVNLAKGIELGTHRRVSQIVHDVLPSVSRYAVLSGPSHAEEVVRRMPTTVVCASTDIQSAELVQSALSTASFRVYTSSDVVGVEIGGALKNVIAIAAGIVDGIGLGDNTKAALITRGLAEIARLAVALGANVQTLYGLAGVGDLYVTCTSRHSRNRAVGERIGKGESLTSIRSTMSAVAEGVTTTQAALELALTAGVELPITEQIAQILFHGADPHEAIQTLMQRSLRQEG